MKSIFVFLAAVLIAEISFSEVPVRSPRSLRAQFDSYTELLRKEIIFNKEKDKKKRLSLLTQVLEQMKTLRGEVEAADNPDVLHMDQVIASLNALPTKKQFSRKNCEAYEASLSGGMTPNDLAADFIRSLCD